MGLDMHEKAGTLEAVKEIKCKSIYVQRKLRQKTLIKVNPTFLQQRRIFVTATILYKQHEHRIVHLRPHYKKYTEFTSHSSRTVGINY